MHVRFIRQAKQFTLVQCPSLPADINSCLGHRMGMSLCCCWMPFPYTNSTVTLQELQWPLTCERLIGRDGSRHDKLKKKRSVLTCAGVNDMEFHLMSMYNCEWEILVSLFTGVVAQPQPAGRTTQQLTCSPQFGWWREPEFSFSPKL